MNRLKLRKRRAEKHGLAIMHSETKPKAWDVVDAGGPLGLTLTRREAINFAATVAAQYVKSAIYGQDATGMWHRWNCERIAYAHTKSKPCKCDYLVVTCGQVYRNQDLLNPT